MLRTSFTRRCARTCRPRTRGDAPYGGYSFVDDAKSAPHPRGCSAPDASGGEAGPVGPAPAGMLRCPRSRRCRSGSRPRTRGDAPLRLQANVAYYESAPHPRGCSALLRRAAGDAVVGPAPAGMLLRSPQCSPVSRGRPRTRGNAPEVSGPDPRTRRSAPHPRGCSPGAPPGATAEGVGPAPAGMLRTGRCRSCAASCRPRTRGDAPSYGVVRAVARWSAPHPRGCSSRVVPKPNSGRVGPAPAGMLPPWSWW